MTSRDVIFLKQLFFAPAVKSESVELGDLSAMKNRAKDAVEEDNDDGDEDTGEQGNEVSDDNSEAGDNTVIASEPILTI